VWQAMAMAVPSRLWLGGVLSVRRDRQLIDALATRVRACARSTRVLVCVDGLSSYVGAIKRAFSDPVPTGKPGRPPRVCPPGLLLAQVVKTSLKRRVVEVSRRIVLGHPATVQGSKIICLPAPHSLSSSSMLNKASLVGRPCRRVPEALGWRIPG